MGSLRDQCLGSASDANGQEQECHPPTNKICSARTLRASSTPGAAATQGAAGLAICLLSLSFAGPTHAQPEENGGGLRVQEVVVTARKISENLQNVPVAVTAISGADVKAHDIKTIIDVQSVAPSLLLKKGNDDPQGMTFMLRGREQNDATLAVDPSVGLYVDGLAIPRTQGMAGSLLDIAQIEVLRGPQGTLYGRNTTGGAINIKTNDPTDQLGGSLDLTAGNFDAWNVIGIFNTPLARGVDARLVVQRGRHAGYGHDLVGDPLESEDSQYYRAKLRAEIGDRIEAVLSAHYESNRSGGLMEKITGLSAPGGGLPAGGFSTLQVAADNGLSTDQAVVLMQSLVEKSRTDFYDNGGNLPVNSAAQRWDVGLNVTAKLPSGLTWRSITGVQELFRHSFFGGFAPGNLFNIQLRTKDQYLSQEFQLLGKEKTVTWVAGVYGSAELGTEDDFTVALPAFIPSGESFSEIRNASAAVYGQAIWEFLPSWRLTLGDRYSWDSRKATVVALSGGQCEVPAPGVESTLTGASQCPRTFQSAYGQNTWLVTIDRRLSPDNLVYAKVATGYRSGGENPAGAVEVETFAPFLPETNVEYELGLKSELLNHRLRTNVAVYRDDYSNLQVTSSIATADGQIAVAVTNAASATIQGVEVDSTLQATSQLRFNASLAYTDAHYIRFIDFTGDRSHEAFAVPKWATFASMEYTQPTPLGRLTLDVDYDWRSKNILDSTAINLADVTQGAYGLLNGRLDLDIDSLDLTVGLFAKNITGTHYYSTALAGDSSLGINLAMAGDPRTFGIEIIKRFGGR